MDVQYINPFIDSLLNAFEMMLGVIPEREAIYLKEGISLTGEVSGIIGFADKNITGSIALCFPRDTALKVYSLLMGEQLASIDENVRDCVGELANIVAGGAKQAFSEAGLTYNISIPTIIIGKNHSIAHKIGTAVVVIPFRFDRYEFNMEVSMTVHDS